MKNNFDIDIVIPWVDGSDKKWLEKKNKYLPQDKKLNIDASAKRYRDWDNLQYLLRSIEKFAPWVRKVFLITDSQKPKWLNLKCKKLVLVDHKDYIPEEYLPTFSSHPIELNMCRIKGLSEHFIYFNDDLFFVKPVKQEDFFDKNGLPRIVAIEKPKTVSDIIFDNIASNNVRTLNTIFTKREVKTKFKKKWYTVKNPIGLFMNIFYDKTAPGGWAGFFNDHLPAPMLKSQIEKCWELFGDVLSAASCNKFRSMFDVNQYLFTEYLLCTGQFVPDRFGRKGRYLDVCDKNGADNVDGVCKIIKKQKFKMICLTDGNVDDFEKTKQKINSAFETILPQKSKFEL